jgi:hypothetical protein
MLLVLALDQVPPDPSQTGEPGTGVRSGGGPAPAPIPAIGLPYGQLPLSFEANAGQFAPYVDFAARGPGYTLFLMPGAMGLAVRQPTSRLAQERRAVSAAGPSLRMSMEGANPEPRAVRLESLPGQVNYFLGSDVTRWRTGIATYSRVGYQDIYPGVDVVYYGNQGRLEYDFLVAPGADPAAIALVLEGADGLAIASNGDLVVPIGDEHFVMRAPRIYQIVDEQGVAEARQDVSGGYTLDERGRVGFEVGAYDRTRPLIIDPVLAYSTYLGGSGADVGYGIAVDRDGYAYVTGTTGSRDFPTVGGSRSGLGGDNDAFVVKLDPSGANLIYATYLGGSGDLEIGYGIAVDTAGRAYVTGLTTSPDFPTVKALQPRLAGFSDAFVTRLSPAGSAIEYSTYLGGDGSEIGQGISVDGVGNTYLTGQTDSRDFPVANAVQPMRAGSAFNTDAFVAKLAPGGDALIYATYLGGSGDEHPGGIGVDPGGHAYVTGSTLSSDFPTANPLQSRRAGPGTSDAFVAKLAPDGTSLIYSTYLGGSDLDLGRSIAVDTGGNAYVTGETRSRNIPTATAGPSPNSGWNAFVAKLDAAGSRFIYATYLGGSGDSGGRGITVDDAGRAHVTGYTGAPDFPIINAPQPAQTGPSDDAFVAKLTPDGFDLIYATRIGGHGNDFGYAIALDPAGRAYITGQTASDDLPVVNPLDRALSGDGDAFVMKIAEVGSEAKPNCALTGTGTIGQGSSRAEITVRDSTNGLQRIRVLKAINALVTVPAFTVGTTDPVIVTAIRPDQTQLVHVELAVTNTVGKTIICTPLHGRWRGLLRR